MNQKPKSPMRQIYNSFSAVVVLSLLLASMGQSGNSISFQEKGGFHVIEAHAEHGADEFSLYLPITLNNYPPETVFGIVIDRIREGSRLDLVVDTDTKWTRAANVAWSDVEPNQGERYWGALDDNLSQWETAVQSGLTNIVVVHSTPSWAQKFPGYFCGPIKQSKLVAFADFMYEIVDRYSKYPYQVKYWEIWNEPDIDPKLVDPDSVFGCWGDINDPYYGGRYYAEMLKVVYPKIKAADPTANVLVGGLLLDCDPNNPPPGSDCTPAKFLEGILVNGGAPYFDGVSFHAYDYYSGALGRYDNQNWNSAWNTTGPVVIEKTQFLKSVLQEKGVSGKFLVNTESALLCDVCVDDTTFETTKAYYLAQSYATAITESLKGNLWFTLLGWRNSGIIDSSNNPLPAYDAYKFAANILISTHLRREIKEYPGVMGYEVIRPGFRLWIVWSLDGEDHPIQLPGTPDAIYDVFGESLPVDRSITITLAPIYIEW